MPPATSFQNSHPQLALFAVISIKLFLILSLIDSELLTIKKLQGPGLSQFKFRKVFLCTSIQIYIKRSAEFKIKQTISRCQYWLKWRIHMLFLS